MKAKIRIRYSRRFGWLEYLANSPFGSGSRFFCDNDGDVILVNKQGHETLMPYGTASRHYHLLYLKTC
jgi:hypothetical protein